MIKDVDYKNLYDDLYRSGYHKKFNSHSTIFYPYISKNLSAYSSILDVGCSTGNALTHLKKNKYNVFGLDISEVAVAKCLERDLEAKTGYSHDIPYDSDMFDAILCTDVLEHIDPSNINLTFKEFKRVLKTEALCLLRICLTVEKNKAHQKTTQNHNFKNLHVSVFPSKFWENSLTENNFQITETIKDTDNYFTVICKNIKP